MDLKNLIPLFYTDDWECYQNSGINNVLSKCYSEAFPYVSQDIRSAICKDHFHDWLLSSVSIFYADSLCVKLSLINQNNKRSISFSNVVSFRVEGSISTDALNFPTETEKTPAIAQVLDIWIAINDNVEYIVLLNDYRYLTITTNKISRM